VGEWLGGVWRSWSVIGWQVAGGRGRLVGRLVGELHSGGERGGAAWWCAGLRERRCEKQLYIASARFMALLVGHSQWRNRI
jgi:hypothetical protein